MKKKIAILLLGACVVASLCACSTKSKEKKKEPAKVEKQDTEKESSETKKDEPDTEVSSEEKLLILKVDDSIEINGNKLAINLNGEDPEMSGGDAVLSYAGSEVTLDNCEWMCDSYVVTVNDSDFYVYAQLGYSNDKCQTYVVKYSQSEGLKTIGHVWGAIEDVDNLSSTSCTISSYADIMGTYATITSYDVTDEGLKNKDTDGYVDFNNVDQVTDGSFLNGSEEGDFISKVYDDNGRHILILKKELTFYSDGGEEKLEAGTIVYPKGYYEDKGQFVVEKDNKTGYFKYEKQNHGFLVDGIDQYEAFEELPYAG